MKTTFQKLQLLGLVTALTIIGISTSKPAQAKKLPVGEMERCELPVCSYQTRTEIESLPQLVAANVLLAASTQSGLPISALKITNTWYTEWSDGCHGVYLPDQECTMAIEPAGWLVTVKVGRQRWVYDTDEDGAFVQLVKQRNLPRFKSRPFPIYDPYLAWGFTIDDPGWIHFPLKPPYLTGITDPGWLDFPLHTMPYFPAVINDRNYPSTEGDNFTEIGNFDKSLPNLEATNDLPEIAAAKTADVPEPFSVLGVLTFGAFSFGLRQKRKSSPKNL